MLCQLLTFSPFRFCVDVPCEDEQLFPDDVDRASITRTFHSILIGRADQGHGVYGVHTQEGFHGHDHDDPHLESKYVIEGTCL